MRKALNFDLDTKKYEEYTGKPSPTAYRKIRNFLKKHDFKHRQGSGYISKESLNDGKVFAIVQSMSMEFEWLGYCVKQIDITNIGKQHSLIDTINNSSKKSKQQDIMDLEI